MTIDQKYRIKLKNVISDNDDFQKIVDGEKDFKNHYYLITISFLKNSYLKAI